MEKDINNKLNSGITLIPLVITIVVMLILAGVAIGVLTGPDGIIGQARNAANQYNQAAGEENNRIQGMLNELHGYGAGTIIPPSGGNNPENVFPGSTSEVTVKLADGMVPVKWNGTSWVVTTVADKDWFSYADTSKAEVGDNNSKWANAMLRDGLQVEGVTDATIATIAEMNGKAVTRMGSMFVWIPRYAYKIESGYHTGDVGEISIKFLNTNNTYKDGSNTSTLLTNPLTAPLSANTSYVAHPAFTWENEAGTKVELEGIWVGKFEASGANASFATSQPGNVLTSNSVILRTVAGTNVSSWRNITVNNSFLNVYNMNNSANAGIYKISENKDKIDPHQIKNSEWGAVAYLAHSAYGRNKTEVTINADGNYYVGANNYIANTNQSTTGNVYGVYDMNGGVWEHVSAYVNSKSNSYLTSASYAKALADAKGKYKDVYEVGVNDDRVRNYALSAKKYGDAVYETSYTSYDGTSYSQSSWNADYSQIPFSEAPVFYRGGTYNQGAAGGLFAFGNGAGEATSGRGFRVCLTVL